jgi:hypothetical protein
MYCFRPKKRKDKIQLYLDCETRSLCDPLPSLIIPWTLQYTFASGSDLTPKTSSVVGLYNISGKQVESVSSTYYLCLSRPPKFEDLNYSTITVPIPGLAKSMSGAPPCDMKTPDLCRNVQAYFFGYGDAIGKYTAILDCQICNSGNKVTCKVKDIFTDIDEDSTIDLLFVAVLRYIALPIQSNITNSFTLPS